VREFQIFVPVNTAIFGRVVALLLRTTKLAGMIMALEFYQERVANNNNISSAPSISTYLIAGYESGHAAVHALNITGRTCSLIYLSQPHSQPLLSIAPNRVAGTFFTSSADAVISSHPLPSHPHFPTAAAPAPTAVPPPGQAPTTTTASPSPMSPSSNNPSKPQSPSLLSQQALASAPAPSSFDPPTSPAEAASSSHADPSPAPSSFAAAATTGTTGSGDDGTTAATSGDAAAAAAAAGNAVAAGTAFVPLSVPPLRSVNTHHAGQQSLQVRSDGRILATAGWDARVRVYSAKTLKELAVLKWHREGCYAAAFAEVLGSGEGRVDGRTEDVIGAEVGAGAGTADSSAVVAKGLGEVRRLREVKAQTTHWIAVGSKDGRVSLWDVY
jgi:ASTRA-associated protein 1